MRRDDWPIKLEEALTKAQYKNFEWGIFDCWLFVADVIKAMTDCDPAAELRGRYSTEKEAELIISGYGGVHGMLESMGFLQWKSRNYAQRGDIVTFNIDNWEAGGICLGINAAFASKSGLSFIKITHCTKAYRVL